MSLQVSVLQSALSALVDPSSPSFVPYQADRAVAASRFCSAYASYAMQAVDQSGDRLLSANLPAMQSSLASGWATTSDAPGAARAFAQAFVAYWTGASFAVGVPPPPSTVVGGNGVMAVETTSVVSSVDPAPMQAALTAEFSRWSAGDAKAGGLAQAMHGGTVGGVRIQIVGLDSTPTPAGPLPCVSDGAPS